MASTLSEQLSRRLRTDGAQLRIRETAVVVPGATVTRLVPQNYSRYLLAFTTPGAVAGLTAWPFATIADGRGLPISQLSEILSWSTHGTLVQQDWYGYGGFGGTIIVLEGVLAEGG